MVPTLEQVAHVVLPRVAPGRALADSEWRTLRAAAAVLMPGATPGIAPERAADNVERFLAIGRSPMAWRVRCLLHLLEYLPVLDFGAPFSALSPDQQRRIVTERMMRGSAPWRLCGRVRLLVIMGAYGDARAESGIGFVPVPLRSRFRRKGMRREPAAEISAQP
jgi:hypothetical protein